MFLRPPSSTLFPYTTLFRSCPVPDSAPHPCSGPVQPVRSTVHSANRKHGQSHRPPAKLFLPLRARNFAQRTRSVAAAGQIRQMLSIVPFLTHLRANNFFFMARNCPLTLPSSCRRSEEHTSEL